MFVAGTITDASIQVNAADGARTYNLSIRVNGVEVATLTLVSGTTGNDTCIVHLAAPVVCGDVVTAFLVRTAGVGGSTFTAESAMISVT